MEWRRARLYLAGAILTVLGFYLFALALEGPGFPLDDAWIHQTYARHLAEEGRWSFQTGDLSSGSTSPLWTLLLAPGHLLGIPPVVWAAALGSVLLALTAYLTASWLHGSLEARFSGRIWLAGLLVPLEWHLAWAALSGMEILAAGLLALVFSYSLMRREAEAFQLGLLLGLGVWLRPDLLSLGVAAGWFWIFRQARRPGRWSWAVRFAAGILVLFVPYLGFHWLTTGRPWPSTFYAKQAEYAVLRELPLLRRYFGQLLPPSAGLLAVVLPGLLAWISQKVAGRRWFDLAPLVWALTYIGAFALRLPVTYQHGRYMMPIIPVLLALAVEGGLRWLANLSDSPIRFVLRRAWPAAVVAGGAVFWVLGAQAYARDVAIIETEMVAAAEWVEGNTEENALVAAHDIGALGYYGRRPILDMAGLVSPEVIPILRDERELAALLDRKGAEYLMTFPEWYPALAAGREPVFSTGGEYSPTAGGSNMAVYRWP